MLRTTQIIRNIIPLNRKTSAMILSIYTYLFTEKGKFYLYNSQTNFFSEISDELYKSLKNRTWAELPGK